MTIEGNIRKFYVWSFFDAFCVFLPYIIYYFQQLGFSLGKIAILQSSMAITLFIMEIPSGYIADRFGRKNSLIISSIFELVSVIILYTATDFYMLIFAHVLLGICSAFMSGADSALIYDTLLDLKREKEFKKIFGKAKFFSEISVIVASLLGALLIGFGIKLTILLTIFAYAILVLTAISLKEPRHHERIEKIPFRKEFSMLIDIVRRSLSNRRLLGLFVYSFIILGVSNTLFLFYQPYFNATSVPLPWFGVIFAVMSIFTGLTALKAHDIEEKLGVVKTLMIMPLFLVVSYLGAGLMFMTFGFVFFFFREMVRGFIFPVLGDYTNKLVESKERATVLSVQNMFSRLGLVVFSTSFGFLSDNTGLRFMYLALGLFILAFTVVVPLLLRKRLTTKL